MAPFGGLFIMCAGLGVMAGVALPRRRLVLVWGGFAAGSISLIVCSRFLSRGIHAAAVSQVTWLFAAILTEVFAFAIFAPRTRRRGERAEAILTLYVVGIHFLFMLPAFGLLAGGVALCCVTNACIFTWKATYPLLRAWLIDGALKVGFGTAMLMTAPVLSLHGS